EPYREGQLLAEKLAESAGEGEVFIRFGLGFGYLFNYLLPRVEKLKGEVVIYEPSYDVFNYFIRLFDISTLFDGYEIRLFVHENADEIRKILPYITKKTAVKTYANYTLGYFLFYGEEIKKCTKSIKEFASEEQVDRVTQAYFKNMWASNNVLNFPYILSGYGCEGLFGVLSGKPAIVVSAGPSLNKNVHLLKEVQGKVFIMAAYTAIKTLEAHGIKPDMYMTVDPGQVPYEVGEEYGYQNIHLLFYASAGRAIINQHKENNFVIAYPPKMMADEVFHNVAAHIGKPMKYEFVSGGGSVSHAIAEFLYRMGAGVIVMLGQDLAFTDGQHHAKEYSEGREDFTDGSAYSDRTRIMVEDIYGGQVETMDAFKAYVEQFEIFAKYYESELKVVDATEGGAKINNTEILTFREAIDRYMLEYTDPDFTKNIIYQAKAQGTMFDESDRGKVQYVFEQMLWQCKKIPPIVDEALDVVEKINKMYSFKKPPTPSELEKSLEELKRYARRTNSYKLVSDAIFATWFAEVDYEMKIRKAEEPEEQFYTRVTSYALAMQKQACEILIPALEEAIAKLKEEGE
ncbi:MAG: DUF115 domain-containing protein, partial [Defluviitaleaceae bacterium]|nr:DUF115 domain-containing protein [Defluviitaleaceae bacterium]